MEIEQTYLLQNNNYGCDAVVSWVKLTVNVLAAILWAASIVIDAVTIASAGDAPYVQC